MFYYLQTDEGMGERSKDECKYGALQIVCFIICEQTKEWVSSLKMNGEVSDVAFSHDGSRMLSFGCK